MVKNMMKPIVKWAKNNITAIVLVITFIPIYIVSQMTGTAFEHWGSTSMEYLGLEFYRWVTCIFLHFNFLHIFFNSIALLAVGSLVSSFIGQWKTLFIFILCGILAEITCSIIISYSEPVFGGGSSGGIFALIAALIVCYLRFPQHFHIKWYRWDVIAVVVFFIFANDNMGSFLTHAFGFIAGVIVCFIMVLSGWINDKKSSFLESEEV